MIWALSRAARCSAAADLYCEGLFFAVLASEVLYFKTDAASRRAYLERAMRPFSPFGEDPKNTTYYEVPTDIIEDADQLVAWARTAVDVQRRLKRTAPKKSTEVASVSEKRASPKRKPIR